MLDWASKRWRSWTKLNAPSDRPCLARSAPRPPSNPSPSLSPPCHTAAAHVREIEGRPPDNSVRKLVAVEFGALERYGSPPRPARRITRLAKVMARPQASSSHAQGPTAAHAVPSKGKGGQWARGRRARVARVRARRPRSRRRIPEDDQLCLHAVHMSLSNTCTGTVTGCKP